MSDQPQRSAMRALVLVGVLGAVAFRVGTATAQTQPTKTYYLYACAESDDEVALITFGPSGAKVAKTITVGSFPAEIEGPHGISVSPDGRYWYVSIAHGFPFGSVHKYETGTDEWVGDVTVGMYPATLDISASTGLLYVVNFNLHGMPEPSSISVVDTESMTEVARVPTGIRPHGSRLSRDGAWHYSVNVMNGELVELDAFSFEIARRLPLPEVTPVAGALGGYGVVSGQTADAPQMAQPTWVTAPTPQGTVYVTGNNAAVIFEVDLAAWEIRRTFQTGPGPYNLDVTPDGKTLVATYKSGGTVGFWNLEVGRESNRIRTTRTIPHGVVVTPDGEYAFVTLEGVGSEPGTVEVYHIPTRRRVDTVDIGTQAGGIAFWKMDER